MAGAEEQKPSMTTAELVTLIKQVKRRPIERDTLYNEIRDYTNVSMNELADPQMN
jgi:aminodeoxyfutalosine synthase